MASLLEKPDIFSISSGKARTHGPHHVAQKSSTTTFPLCSARLNEVPSSNFVLTGGAALPTIGSLSPDAPFDPADSLCWGSSDIRSNSFKSSSKISTRTKTFLSTACVLILDKIEGACPPSCAIAN